MSLDYDFNASDLDEFLVEYVDGTMDSVVREAFEEFLRVYPEVAEQVDCLTSIRTELCRLGDKCRCHAPPGFQARLKEQLLEESDTGVVVKAEVWLPHLNAVALAFSLTLLALALGLSSSSFSTQDEAPAVATTAAEDDLLNASLQRLPSSSTISDYTRSVALNRTLHWNVSHTHPGSHEVHVEAAFERPVLMSVRRDVVEMRPIADRSSPLLLRP